MTLNPGVSIKVGTKFESDGEVFTVVGFELFMDRWENKTRVIFDKPVFSSRPKILASTLFNAMKDGDLKIIEGGSNEQTNT